MHKFPIHKIKCLIFTLVVQCILWGCSSSPLSTSKMSPKPQISKPHHQRETRLSLTPAREPMLLAFYSRWQGTPYRYGGMNRRGVDCSGFVYLAYQQAFNQGLPRKTEDQMSVGKPVHKSQLQFGDLVFFKTGKKVRHVGIYLGNNEFMHASTSIGVTISSLNNIYWSPRFLKARRIRH